MNLNAVRKIALALPESIEAPHFDRTSFRVNKRIFATAPEQGGTLNVFLDDLQREHALALSHEFIELLWWGKKVSGLTITLATADQVVVKHLLTQAWKRRAPKHLIASSGL